MRCFGVRVHSSTLPCLAVHVYRPLFKLARMNPAHTTAVFIGLLQGAHKRWRKGGCRLYPPFSDVRSILLLYPSPLTSLTPHIPHPSHPHPSSLIPHPSPSLLTSLLTSLTPLSHPSSLTPYIPHPSHSSSLFFFPHILHILHNLHPSTLTPHSLLSRSYSLS